MNDEVSVLVVSVLVVDGEACQMMQATDECAATTLAAVVSEDPSRWSDVVGCWSRYRTAGVPETLEHWSSTRMTLEEARDTLAGRQWAEGDGAGWLVVDLVNKRLVTGGQFEIGGKQQRFSLSDERSDRVEPLSLQLPPWWELVEQAAIEQLDGDRAQPLCVPRLNRDVLYGQPLLEDLSRRILKLVSSTRWASVKADTHRRARYDFTVEVHREWLMTPREDLAGSHPRRLLHGATDWIDGLAKSQERRLLAGCEVVALPTNFTGYDEAAMGTAEMVIYFDLCRELIEQAWEWCLKHATDFNQWRPRQAALIDFLATVKENWLSSPFEGGASPELILECCRRRVPRATGMPIVGMTSLEHAVPDECNCPICKMMAEGLLGPCIEMLDGHHLELDDEFAFSMYESPEEWESSRNLASSNDQLRSSGGR